jgi:hypothetical protein
LISIARLAQDVEILKKSFSIFEIIYLEFSSKLFGHEIFSGLAIGSAMRRPARGG